MTAADLTPAEHETSAIVDEAAAWYFSNFRTCERPIVPALRQRFGMTSHQAICAIRQVTLMRARAA
ncbi:hypothetical protein X769_18255 [Mesorhizobium sp. LSJC268A00]|uniref:hypothetical protein n=1 Tax=unclassified Mesorhizobium TaxID=325217 RepID=UPI0003CDE7FD|nr:hypothetical protein [Mesorhizobium sp. LSJC268A00]ESX03352.1 hypothetical protein X769_18255 [Mesorhizobium sp. LSJC268A00]